MPSALAAWRWWEVVGIGVVSGMGLAVLLGLVGLRLLARTLARPHPRAEAVTTDGDSHDSGGDGRPVTVAAVLRTMCHLR